MLEAAALMKRYNGVVALDHLDLVVRPGEVFCLLGANGAGKTTTVMALAGHLPAAAGTVELEGSAVTSSMDARARAGVAVLTQERCVFMGLSVRDNLRLGRGTLDDALSVFPELEPHLHRPTGLLSGGQQQMLAVARVLAARPRVLLADELSAGLAPLIVERLLDAVSAAAARTGMAVVLVEQHVAQALEYADTAAVLQRGRVRVQDSAASLAERSEEIAGLYL